MSNGRTPGYCLCSAHSVGWTTTPTSMSCCGASSIWAKRIDGDRLIELEAALKPGCAAPSTTKSTLISARQAHARMAAGSWSARRGNPRELLARRFESQQWAGEWRHDEQWRTRGRACRRRDRRLDAAACSNAPLADPDPAWQRLFDDDGPAGEVPSVSDDLRGASRSDHAAGEYIPDRLDDGVRWLRHAAQSGPPAAAARDCDNVSARTAG